MYKIVVTPHAARDFRHLPHEILLRVDRAISQFKNREWRQVKHLQNSKLADYRIRVGDYRILFDIDEPKRLIIILRVGHRKDIYQ